MLPPLHIKRALWAAIMALLLLADCAAPAPGAPAEVPVTVIPLAGPVARNSAEISGIAWHGDDLILLPQYPNRFGNGADGALLALPRADIEAYLDGVSSEPLVPVEIPFIDGGLRGQIQGFEGYEAIAFAGDRAFLTIEASQETGMIGYLVSGEMRGARGGLVLDPTRRAEIPAQAGLGNLSDEAVLVAADEVLTFYEANGAAINATPVAHRFDHALVPWGTILVPSIEYRITDVSALDPEGRFWAINLFWPSDIHLKPQRDPLAERFGKGPTHARSVAVERLVEFQYTDTGIELTDTPPIQLELPGIGQNRNWEALARLGERGFVLMTDKYPKTMLAFVRAQE
jgi:hypothetical protein